MAPSPHTPEWNDVWALEQSRVARRRRAQNIPDEAGSESATVGLALSGGGIRSATFSLGLMRGLAQHRVLESFDYVSTASGGGYAGAFFNSLFARWKVQEKKPGSAEPQADAEAERARAKVPYDTLRGPICRPGDGGSPLGWQLWWLRSSGRYLAPTGAGDYVYAAALAIRNLLAIHYVIGLTLVIAAALSIAIDSTVRVGLDRIPHMNAIAAVPGAGFGVLGAVMFVLWLMPLGLAYFATEMPKPGTAQAAREHWWWSPTWRNTFFAGAGSALLAVLMWPSVAERIVSSAAAGPIDELLGRFGFLFTGSRTLASITGVVGAIIAGSLLFLESAGRFVEAGKHMPSGTSIEKSPQGKMLATRVVLTKRLALGLKFFLVVLAVAALIYVSRWLLLREWWSTFAATTGVGGTVVVALVKKLASSLALPGPTGRRVAIPFGMVALVLGFALGAALAIGWTAFAWGSATTFAGENLYRMNRPIAPLLEMLGLLVPLALITGVSFQFINLSSIQNLYSSRLVRAYLGATNPARATGDTRWIHISDTHPDDNLSLSRYYDRDNAAPLHLINVTLNETVSPTDPLVQRDRHGRSFAVSPDFLCVDGVWSRRLEPATEYVAPPSPLRRVTGWVRRFFPWGRKEPTAGEKPTTGQAQQTATPSTDLPEPLALGSWIGISGAAFSTGIGRGTSIGKSLLLGIANVRLGHWWRSAGMEVVPEGSNKVNAALRFIAKRFRTQAYLAAELLGRFSGRYAPYWYLSDGGHFENTGVYELLRRKVGVILCLDNGADPDYAWDDLANLIRLSRIDFGCEFEELSASEIWAETGLAGLTLDADSKGRGGFEDERCLRMFWVSHEARGSKEGSLLIVVKPRLVADAPVDVQQYARSSEPFPQETTADQFFSEEQWESYRKLGETIGDRLARAIVSGSSSGPADGLRRLQRLRVMASRETAGAPVPTLPLKTGFNM